MKNYFQKHTSAAPLTVFRMVFGLLLFVSIVRFWWNGWIHELYIEPQYFFPYYGFELVTSFGEYTYVLFAICAIAALMVALGCFYRISSICLFLSFTYIELIDKSTYLNHYYFVSMISLMMIFLPAHAYFSVDAFRNKNLNSHQIPQWSLDVLRLFVCIVYVLAGLAKVNSDWLLEAQPLRIWLPAKNDLPFVGGLFNHVWVAYAFSWIGCIYDLSIPFFLVNPKTRVFAYFAVLIFHSLTSLLFPIGMFPYIMIATALIFFSSEFHQRIINKIGLWIKISGQLVAPSGEYQYKKTTSRIILAVFTIFFLIQIAVPFRYLLYPGELFWTEEGYRFSWRVMLMEKAGYAEFTVSDNSGRHITVDNSQFLTPLQEKMMSAQPDMILQYAHMLRDHYASRGFISPSVYVDSYVTLNGRLGKPLIDPTVDLASQQESFHHKKWILTFNDEVKGL